MPSKAPTAKAQPRKVSPRRPAHNTAPAVDIRCSRMPKQSVSRTVYLDLQVGDVVEMGKSWVAVLEYDKFGTATLIADKGPKARILSEGIQTEMAPKVWITRVADRKAPKLTLKFRATRNIAIRRRREPQLQTLADGIREMRASRFARASIIARRSEDAAARPLKTKADVLRN
jgi:hypothetical protein